MSELLKLSLGQYNAHVDNALLEAEKTAVLSRIWKRDLSLWSSDRSHQRIINNSLGWLTAPENMKAATTELHEFARAVAKDFTQVMVCGMGGSSLCPEVLAKTFGRQPGFPQLLVLDSTDPDYIAALKSQVDIARCLFIIASKSGTTTEPLCFYKYWYDQVAQQCRKPGDSFVLITDPGSPLLDEAREKNFRRVFLNQSDIGGRYSALSHFGLVPAALMGLDLDRLLSSAIEMAAACGSNVPPRQNPGALLGAVMSECANAGRDKLTLLTTTEIATLGLWIEQLVAESTGKEGKGILPVSGEPAGAPEVYGADRLFISIGDTDESELNALEVAGHPVIRRKFSNPYELGGEFFLWEFATAFTGWRLGINPFDQPNVQESKDATKKLLQIFVENGSLPKQSVVSSDERLTVYASDRKRESLSSSQTLDVLQTHLASAERGDYFAFLNYVEEKPAMDEAMLSMRKNLRDRTHCATTSGYGPRFLHSTGQLHKGGPDTGIFIQITAPDEVDLAIPGEPYSFSVLKQAQALGDFEALSSRGRRAVRVDLGTNAEAGMRTLAELITKMLDEDVRC